METVQSHCEDRPAGARSPHAPCLETKLPNTHAAAEEKYSGATELKARGLRI